MHHRADMVFMRMGDDQRLQGAAIFREPDSIRHHDIHFRLIRPGKAKPAIHRQQGAITAIDIKVHSDLTRPAQRDEGKIASHDIHGANQNPNGEDREARFGGKRMKDYARPAGATLQGLCRDRFFQ